MSIEEQFKDLYLVVRALRDAREGATDAGLRQLYDSEAYAGIVALGSEVLPLLLNRVADGDAFLGEAVCRIAGLDRRGLTGREYPTDRELSDALTSWRSDVRATSVLQWTAVSGSADEPCG